ncbi:MAG: hypothetical protein M3Q06_02395 [Bacteroidota bacterium]|nr:hypothetical protein [Bacteroidota bacterium]
MKRMLRQNRHRKGVVEFSFDKEELQALQWEEENEFQWRGCMYDVIEKKVVDGKTIITCISDKEEDRLLNEYRENTAHRNRADGPLLKMLPDYFLPDKGVLLLPLFRLAITTFFEHVSSLLFQPSFVVGPPPKLC